jgi:hypothetical protein
MSSTGHLEAKFISNENKRGGMARNHITLGCRLFVEGLSGKHKEIGLACKNLLFN